MTTGDMARTTRSPLPMTQSGLHFIIIIIITIIAIIKNTTRPPLPRQFSICNSGFFAGLITQELNSQMNWYSIGNEENNGAWIYLYSSTRFKDQASEEIDIGVGITVNGAWLNPAGRWPLRFNRWQHMCITVDLDEEVFSFVADGYFLGDLKVEGMSKGVPTTLAGRLTQDSSHFTVANYMMGNMQVFGRKLSNEEMISITAGEDCGREGDYLAWKDMQWEVKGKVLGWVNVTRNKMCSSKNEVFRFVNTQAGHYDDHKSFCRRMHRSKIPADTDKSTLEELLDYYRHAAMYLDGTWTTHPDSARCYFYWLPYRFNRDGDWTSDYTSQRINFMYWGNNQDPKDALEGSCVYGEAGNSSEIVSATNQGGGGKWAIHYPPCHGHGGMCSICQKSSQPMLRLRGLCRDSTLQNMFTPVNDEQSRLGYVGLSQTNIVYNTSTYLWVASNMGYSEVVATNGASLASGLLGTSEWTVYNDSRKCSPDNSYKILLTLTGCRKDEFTCVDANCIPMESRCNVDIYDLFIISNMCALPSQLPNLT